MKILCVNTAFCEAQIVLKTENGVCGKTLDANAKASENVMPAIDEILNEQNVNINEIDVIGVVVGPGSFTGVRIGVALVKGFVAVNKNIKICAVNSLDLMAKEFCLKNCKQNFCVVQNALGGRFFLKKFDKDGNKMGDDELVGELPKETLKVGLVLEDLSEVDEKIEITQNGLLKFVEEKIEKQEFEDVMKLAPVYIRLSQAEESLLKKESGDVEV